jgi:RecJ-like exonuclease
MGGINREIVEKAVKAGAAQKERGIRLFGRMNRPVHKALEYSTNPYIPGISGDESASIQFLSSLGIELKKDGSWKALNDLSEEEMKKLATAIICERIRESEASPEEIFGEIYSININGDHLDAREMATSLNACGRMEQSSVGILSVLGVRPFDDINGIVAGYRKMITKYIKWVKESGPKETEHAFYINAGDQIHENFIGTITSICEKSAILDSGKVIFGLAETEDGKVKVSARAPKEVVERGLNLKDMMGEVTGDDGHGGGHAAAAGAFIPRGKEKEFIGSCEKYLKDKLK